MKKSGGSGLVDFVASAYLMTTMTWGEGGVWKDLVMIRAADTDVDAQGVVVVCNSVLAQVYHKRIDVSLLRAPVVYVTESKWCYAKDNASASKSR